MLESEREERDRGEKEGWREREGERETEGRRRDGERERCGGGGDNSKHDKGKNAVCESVVV